MGSLLKSSAQSLFILIQTIRCTHPHIVLIPFSSVQFQPFHSFPSLSHFIHSIQLFLIPSILSHSLYSILSHPFILSNSFSSHPFYPNPFQSHSLYSILSHPFYSIQFFLILSIPSLSFHSLKKIFLIPFILSIPFSSKPFLSKPF